MLKLYMRTANSSPKPCYFTLKIVITLLKQKLYMKLNYFGRFAHVLAILAFTFNYTFSQALISGSKIRNTNVSNGSQNLTPSQLLNKAYSYADAYGVPRRLFESLIRQESSWKMAVSYKGAGCYTQLMPDTARRLGLRVDAVVDERFNVDKCLAAGAKYLRFQLDLFKDVRLALAGYNAGEGNVLKFGRRIPPFKETMEYVERICFMAYGQRGHSIALAYNQPYAAQLANNLYRTNFYRYANPQQINEIPLPQAPENANEPAETSAKAEPQAPKPTRTKVEMPARIPVAGLFFTQQ